MGGCWKVGRRCERSSGSGEMEDSESKGMAAEGGGRWGRVEGGKRNLKLILGF